MVCPEPRTLPGGSQPFLAMGLLFGPRHDTSQAPSRAPKGDGAVPAKSAAGDELRGLEAQGDAESRPADWLDTFLAPLGKRGEDWEVVSLGEFPRKSWVDWPGEGKHYKGTR